jgi:hypothetical protein
LNTATLKESEMDVENAIADLSAQVEALPDDAADALLDLLRGSFRVILVPGYRTETLLNQPTGCAFPFVLHASGLARTNSAGEFEINVVRLLHCIQPGAPMPGGLRSPVVTGNAAVVPGGGTSAIGTPVTVVTGSGPKPALFTATPDGFVAGNQGSAPLGWRGVEITDLSAHHKVKIKSFEPDGAVFPRAGFNWHVTLEVRFLVGG